VTELYIIRMDKADNVHIHSSVPLDAWGRRGKEKGKKKLSLEESPGHLVLTHR